MERENRRGLSVILAPTYQPASTTVVCSRYSNEDRDMLDGSETRKAFGSLIGANLLSTINNNDGMEVKEKE